jgi:hypothetical protein
MPAVIFQNPLAPSYQITIFLNRIWWVIRYNAAPDDTHIGLPYLPSNHQSNFAPEPEPILRVGVKALTPAALAYLPAAEATLEKLSSG